MVVNSPVDARHAAAPAMAPARRLGLRRAEEGGAAPPCQPAATSSSAKPITFGVSPGISWMTTTPGPLPLAVRRVGGVASRVLSGGPAVGWHAPRSMTVAGRPYPRCRGCGHDRDGAPHPRSVRRWLADHPATSSTSSSIVVLNLAVEYFPMVISGRSRCRCSPLAAAQVALEAVIARSRRSSTGAAATPPYGEDPPPWSRALGESRPGTKLVLLWLVDLVFGDDVGLGSSCR